MRTIDCQKGNDVLGFVSVDAETGVGPPAEVPDGTLPCRHRTFYLGALDSGRTHESGCSAFWTLGVRRRSTTESRRRLGCSVGLHAELPAGTDKNILSLGDQLTADIRSNPAVHHRQCCLAKGDVLMHFIVNGEAIDVEADIRTSLLDLMRNYLGFTGTKKGCDQGACRACTVLVDGERINSCLALAVQYQGRDITTVEGLAANGNLHPLQQAFVEHDGFQCGYCTPGQLCSAIGMAGEIERNIPSIVTGDLAAAIIPIDEREIRERMSGNLCRCGAYNGIVEAIAETLAHQIAAPTEERQWA